MTAATHWLRSRVLTFWPCDALATLAISRASAASLINSRVSAVMWMVVATLASVALCLGLPRRLTAGFAGVRYFRDLD